MGKKSGGRPPVERAVSAGGVVCRWGESGLEVVVCGRDKDGVWGLPKGTPNEGESLEGAALREVQEETGLKVALEDKVGVVEYWFAREGIRYFKRVHFYLMEATGGSTGAHDTEYDRVEWLPVEAALKRMSFRNEIEMVEKARTLLEKKG